MAASHILNDDEKLLIRKAEDKIKQCVTRYSIYSTGFLNEREQDILLSFLNFDSNVKYEFSGGYSDAVRRLMVFCPEYVQLDEENYPISAVRASFYKDYQLTHRDFLGALIGHGISKDSIGDILVDKENHKADIIIKREIKEFLLREFVSAGRAKLTVKEISLQNLYVPSAQFEIITDTVASPRIDAIASCGFKISRDSASSLIKSGRLYLNRRLCTECDKTVEDNSIINATGYGKFKVCISDKISKKGRIFIKVEKYL